LGFFLFFLFLFLKKNSSPHNFKTKRFNFTVA
jgi:hypothetical protein